ncbi:hypothetical protein [Shimia sp. MMG029]|uniref:hypothetical protein n=1 Tax=Shimia sp. MMG029 TaxID=3021978 RepID=UPI0022FF42BC|nr:hypothetical protein [Shimia sp. MMG029]MDA5555217.1 hypothetical protein [Shimia sp. MMG029]
MSTNEQNDSKEADDLIIDPEEFFHLLPPTYQSAALAWKDKGVAALHSADKQLMALSLLLQATSTSASLSYIYKRLCNAKFEATTDGMMEQIMLTTAFAVTYARLFANGKGAYRLKSNLIPKSLKPAHEELIDLRNKRYAHNDTHGCVEQQLSYQFDGFQFSVHAETSIGFHVGGKKEWGELVELIDNHMHERLMSLLKKLEEQTGFKWTFPNGPAPDWLR